MFINAQRFFGSRYKVGLMCDPDPLPLKIICCGDLQTKLDSVTQG